MDKELQDYFLQLKGLGIDLDDEQKNWYVARESTQKDNMRREYPSTPDESWEQSNEGMYYGKLMTMARIEKRIGFVPYEEAIPVYTVVADWYSFGSLPVRKYTKIAINTGNSISHFRFLLSTRKN